MPNDSAPLNHWRFERTLTIPTVIHFIIMVLTVLALYVHIESRVAHLEGQIELLVRAVFNHKVPTDFHPIASSLPTKRPRGEAP